MSGGAACVATQLTSHSRGCSGSPPTRPSTFSRGRRPAQAALLAARSGARGINDAAIPVGNGVALVGPPSSSSSEVCDDSHERRTPIAARAVRANGRGRLVLVAGEPGIGKSRLVGGLADEVLERGELVAWGACREAFEQAWADARERDQPEGMVAASPGLGEPHVGIP